MRYAYSQTGFSLVSFKDESIKNMDASTRLEIAESFIPFSYLYF